MSNEKPKKADAKKESANRVPYEPPAIIYEGLMTTRAGTPARSPAHSDSVDPADIFGD